MKSYTIEKNDDGQRLNRFLMRCVPSLSAGAMYKYLRTKRIKLNGKRCEASDRLSEGDIVELYINDDFFAQQKREPEFMRAGGSLEIVYEDENIALLYKPVGVIIHNDKDNFTDTLLNRFLRHLYTAKQYSPSADSSFTPAFCNRLDRGTQGIVIAGKTPQAVRELNELIKERLIVKKYLCVCCGSIKDGVYDAFWNKNDKTNTVKVTAKPFDGCKDITTGFDTLACSSGLSLVQATLYTGRTHQIRAHLAMLGAPILGDMKYSDGSVNKRFGVQGQLLCAYKLVFSLDSSPQSPLFYLNGREFSLKSVDFAEKYFPNCEY